MFHFYIHSGVKRIGKNPSGSVRSSVHSRPSKMCHACDSWCIGDDNKTTAEVEHCIAKPRISLLRFLGSFLPVLLEYLRYFWLDRWKSHMTRYCISFPRHALEHA